jgi:hypothetical protein
LCEKYWQYFPLCTHTLPQCFAESPLEHTRPSSCYWDSEPSFSAT